MDLAFCKCKLSTLYKPLISSYSPQQKYDFMTEKLHLKMENSKGHFTRRDSDPVVVMVLKGHGIINSVKNIIGLEDPSKAKPGTINGDFMFEGSRRIVVSSENSKEAEGDIKVWFTNEELVR